MKIKKVYLLFFTALVSTELYSSSVTSSDDEFSDTNNSSTTKSNDISKSPVKAPNYPKPLTFVQQYHNLDEGYGGSDNSYSTYLAINPNSPTEKQKIYQTFPTGIEIATMIKSECDKLTTIEEKEDFIMATIFNEHPYQSMGVSHSSSGSEYKARFSYDSPEMFLDTLYDPRRTDTPGLDILIDTIKKDNSAQSISDAKNKIYFMILARRKIINFKNDLISDKKDTKYLYERDRNADSDYKNRASFFEKITAQLSNFKAFISKVTRIALKQLSPAECLEFARQAKTPQELELWFTKARNGNMEVFNITEIDLLAVTHNMMQTAMSKAEKNQDFTLLDAFNKTKLPLMDRDRYRMNELIKQRDEAIRQKNGTAPRGGSERPEGDRPGQDKPREDNRPKEPVNREGYLPGTSIRVYK